MEAESEIELQEELQRFVSQFTDRITQAIETIERSPGASVAARDEALRKNLLYVASAMEIVSGPTAEINLVDMIVFVRLCRSALERHFIPELYGDEGGELAQVFARSEEELDRVALRVLTHAQREQVAAVIDAWLAENPEQHRVEGIRFADFATAAAGAAAEKAVQAKGLFSSVKSATRAANQALILTERALFLVNRMPFLWRLQARVGAREMLGDAVAQLSDGPDAPVQRITRKAQHLMRRGVLYVAALGGTAMVAWWIGSFIHR